VKQIVKHQRTTGEIAVTDTMIEIKHSHENFKTCITLLQNYLHFCSTMIWWMFRTACITAFTVSQLLSTGCTKSIKLSVHINCFSRHSHLTWTLSLSMWMMSHQSFQVL